MAETVPPLTQLLRDRITDAGPLSFYDFMEAALYEPELGYYRKAHDRIGKSAFSDFYTSSSLTEAFVALLEESFHQLRPPLPGPWHLVEAGAEKGGLPWSPSNQSWEEVHAVGAGQALPRVSPMVLFSNELFDARPFHRLIFQDDQWQELQVTWDREENGFREFVAPIRDERLEPWLDRLPPRQTEGYHLDLPTGAAHLLRKLLQDPWEGLFVAIDYGRTWETLASETPAGTLRSYRQHQQESNILQDPGGRDITGHICWDWLEEELQNQGFSHIQLQRQETYFVQHSTRALEKQLHQEGDQRADPIRRQIAALLHPAHFGQAFQVLSARRVGS